VNGDFGTRVGEQRRGARIPVDAADEVGGEQQPGLEGLEAETVVSGAAIRAAPPAEVCQRSEEEKSSARLGIMRTLTATLQGMSSRLNSVPTAKTLPTIAP